MSNLNEIEAIRRRREEIATEIAKLQSEADEIDIALRVLERFAPSKTESEHPKLGPPRPDGLPSNYEMFAAVLQDASRSGRSGLTASEMVEAVGKRFWPGVQGPQITSFIYQFAKKGRLVKGKDGRFRMPSDGPRLVPIDPPAAITVQRKLEEYTKENAPEDESSGGMID